jgi:hypothetical protein
MNFIQTNQKKKISPVTYNITYGSYTKEEIENILRNYAQSCLNSAFLGYLCFEKVEINYKIVLHKYIEVHSEPPKK